jgi:hypothetical protein
VARSRRSTPRPATAPVVRLERGAEELTITLDRPDRHNAFSARMRDALAEALALAAIDPSLAVVLRGNGPSFCSGGDLDEFGTLPDPATAHLVRTTRSPARLLAEIGARPCGGPWRLHGRRHRARRVRGPGGRAAGHVRRAPRGRDGLIPGPAVR